MADPPLEIYSDVFRFSVTPYGVAVTFGTNEAHPNPGKPGPARDEVTVRMSLEQAKVMTMLFRRNLKQYERDNGLEISLPYQLYTGLGIAREDWLDGGAPG